MISQAAIKDEMGKIWTLPRPNRHGAVLRLMRTERGLKDSDLSFNYVVMGFVDEDGKFYDRREALHDAIDNKQPIYIYNPGDPDDSNRRADPNPSKEGGLASEDLW